jgi:hypothetical protein
MAFGFWKSKKPVPALPAPAGGGDPLRAAFARARFGNFCRTLTLSHPENGDLPQYRYAVLIGMEAGWRVMEIAGQDAENKLAPRAAPVLDGVDFLTAIEDLAAWQLSQAKLGYEYDPGEAAKLGAAYFIPFGERENLAFDVNDQPHPTARGEIATAGYFTPEAQERAKASLGMKAPPPALAEGLFELFLSRPLEAAAKEDPLMAEAKHKAGLLDILDIFKELAFSLECAFEHRLFEHEQNILYASQHDLWAAGNLTMTGGGVAGTRKYAAHLSEKMQSSHNLESYFIDRLHTCQNMCRRMDMPKESIAAYETASVAFLTVFYAMAAKYSAQYAGRRNRDRLATMQEAERYTRAADKLFRSLNPPQGESFTASQFALDGGRLRVPPVIGAFTKKLEATLQPAEKAPPRRFLLAPPLPAAMLRIR